MMSQNQRMTRDRSNPVVAITGGIGSGKTTVSSRLAKLGACVIDSDVIAREVVEPGTKGLDMIVDRFGHSMLADDGALDRPKLAALVFSDSVARSDLNGILHPLIEEEMKARVGSCLNQGEIPVVLVIPLLFETNAVERYGISKVIVVDVPLDVAVSRVVASREITAEEVRARLASQASREERLSKADFIIDNSSDETSLDQKVQELWRQLKVFFSMKS